MIRFDTKKAYRQMHIWVHIMDEYMVVLKYTTAALCHLLLGSTPYQVRWFTISEMVFDLVNNSIECKFWDPSDIHSQKHKLLPEPDQLPDDTPFGIGVDLYMVIPDQPLGNYDGYIGNYHTIIFDKEGWVKSGLSAIP